MQLVKDHRLSLKKLIIARRINRIITLRKLEIKDIDGILEWMTDTQINCFFRFDANMVTKKSVEEFIIKSYNSPNDIHLAIVDDCDEYLGTVSLKEIDDTNKTAEFAISLRKKSQGTGAAKFAAQEILKIAFNEKKLNRVFLNVLSDNLRAIAFYRKFGFVYEGEFVQHIVLNKNMRNLSWFRMLKNEFTENEEKI